MLRALLLRYAAAAILYADAATPGLLFHCAAFDYLF